MFEVRTIGQASKVCLLAGESLSTEQQKRDDNRAFRSIAWLICGV